VKAIIIEAYFLDKSKKNEFFRAKVLKRLEIDRINTVQGMFWNPRLPLGHREVFL